MPKVLAQTGTSLADVYDVEGSIAGVEQLISQDVQLTHEMGQTIFAERLVTSVIRIPSTAIEASTAWNVVFSALTLQPVRVIGVQVSNIGNNSAARVTDAQLSIREPVQGREVAIWVWDGNVNAIRIVEDDDPVAAAEILRYNPGDIPGFPFIMAPTTAPRIRPEISFRGITAAFGAGTVELVANIYLAFAAVGGVSSEGLPVPSW